MDEKLVKDLSFEAHRKMDVLLLPSNPGRDWKTLAYKMGYSMETILYFESKKDKGPVMELIKDYEDRGKTISELISFLNEMERFDLIEDLQPFIEKTLTPLERQEKEKQEFERRQTQVGIEKKKATMQKYHEKILQTHFEILVNDLEPVPVMRYLYQKDIISEDDMDAILSKYKKRQMNKALIFQLKRKGSDAFKRLVEGLQKSQSFLAEMLLREEEKQRLKEMQNINLSSASTSHSASELGESDFQGKNASRKDVSMDDKSRDILIRRTLRKDVEPLKLLPDLVDVLDSIDRNEIRRKNSRADAVDELLHIPPRRGQKALEEFKKALQKVQPHLTSYLERNTEIKTVCPHYDVFICYAGPDKSFADEILHYLEKGPYYMKVCIDYRDFLPGADLLETAAKAIEERCNKVLLILSENFHKCEVADFQAKIALSLSPGAKKMILIPILYRPCQIPSTLRFITYLDYTTEHARKYFWNKLLASLGYKGNLACNGKA